MSHKAHDTPARGSRRGGAPGATINEVSPEVENQELRETIEVVFQITGQLDVEPVVKNVVWSFLSKFPIPHVTFVLTKDVDADAFELIHYRGTERADVDFQMPSLATLIASLGSQEFSQTHFSTLREHYRDEVTIASLGRLDTDVICTLRTDRGVSGVVLLPHKTNGEEYTTTEIHFVTRILRFAAVALENANLYWQATTDRMTRLYSHHFFLKNLDDEINRARRLGEVFSLIMFDIDNFKRFNDTYGHLQGDIIIKEIASLLLSCTRSIDVCARYGGEEFAVIVRGIGLEGATSVAERVRRRVQAHPFPGRESPLHVTISLGVTEFDPQVTCKAEEMMAVADKALYASKGAGRNRVTALRVSPPQT
jgi:diguanylate cyclase (GGDEF)-like protein